MTSRFCTILVTIVLLLARILPSLPIRQCDSNSFYNRTSERCEECSRFCPDDTVMTEKCTEDADVVCCRPPTACASGWYRNRSRCRCLECTRYCPGSLDVITPCKDDSDMVCGTREEPRPVPKSSPRTPTVSSSTPLVTTHHLLEESSQQATTPKPGQAVPTSWLNVKPDATKETPQHSKPGLTQETFPDDSNVSSDWDLAPSTRQKADDTNVYLQIAVSVPVSVAVVVAVLLAVYCARKRCRDCAGEKDLTMGVAKSSGMQRTVNSTQGGGGLPISLQLPDPTLLQPPPQFRCNSGGSNPTSSIAVEYECGEANLCACATYVPPSVASDERWGYEERRYHGRSSSLSNMYPPVFRSTMAPSSVLLCSDGTTETHLSNCACAGDVCSAHHCCYGRRSSMGVVYHPLPSNCSVSTFSVVSGGSAYSV